MAAGGQRAFVCPQLTAAGDQRAFEGAQLGAAGKERAFEGAQLGAAGEERALEGAQLGAAGEERAFEGAQLGAATLRGEARKGDQRAFARARVRELASGAERSSERGGESLVARAFEGAQLGAAGDQRAFARARVRELASGAERSSERGGETLVARASRLLLEPVDAAWLAAMRIVLGIVLGVSMLRFLAYGWIERFWVAPTFHFKYWGFAWVEPLSSAGMHGLFVVLTVLAFAMAAGVLFRVSAVLFAAGLSYVQLIDVTTYLNHYYLAALLVWLLSVTPANRVWSVDAWIAQRWRSRRDDVGPRDPTVAAGVLHLFRVQVAVVYVGAGLAKLQSDWLVHAQPLRIWLGARVDLPVLGEALTWPWVPLAMSWAGFLFDATIVAWLLWGRTRKYAYAVVIAFHVLTRVLFPIGMFPVIMIVAALVFFPPDWPRAGWRAVRRVFTARAAARARARGRVLQPVAAEQARRGDLQPSAAGPETVAPRATRRQRLVIAAGVAYCLVQLLVPMRSLAYGGNVLWHEQGMRFSWRVMVRAKGGTVTFVVHDRAAGKTFHVSPRQYLNDLQESELVSQPDLILQLAHHIRRDLERKGLGPLEVRVDARASLNGRPSQPLIDPRVDLTTIEHGLAPADWILPAPDHPPPHTRPVR